MGNRVSRLFANSNPRLMIGNINEKCARSAPQQNAAHLRYHACSLLKESGMASVIWLEDLLVLHGSITTTWDLNLLVENTAEATKTLITAGYQRLPPDAFYKRVPVIHEKGIRLAKSQSVTTAVVLLPAQAWYFEMSGPFSDQRPPLHYFLNSVMEMWLNMSSREYVDQLGYALYLAGLIDHCYALEHTNGTPIKSLEYAENLWPEHRELHFDILASGKESFDRTARHDYHVRRYREIKEGTFLPVPYRAGEFRLPLTTLLE